MVMDSEKEATILHLASRMSKSLVELEGEVDTILKRDESKKEAIPESCTAAPSVVAEIVNILEWNITKFYDLISQMRSGIFNRLS